MRCTQAPDVKNTLYKSDEFTITRDSIIQGNNIAVVLSPTAIKSNYASPANEIYSNRIHFKFSLNEKDNDLAQGMERKILINGDKESEIYVFGQPSGKTDGQPGILPTDYPFTFRLDMRPVLEQFEKHGFYEAVDGSKVAKTEFKGVYIAGSSLPLSWDWVGLEEKGLELTDPDGDGIYEIDLILNPKIESEERTWKLSSDISHLPQLSSDIPMVDALFNMAMQESVLAVEPDSTFRTGAEWGGVWTRDISYSIYLALAYLNPEVAKISLMKKVNRKRIIQDTGSGGSWPVSSDRVVWALAVWEVYKVTGEREWLEECFEIIQNSAADDYLTLRSETCMYKGESSFLDWREQTYPKWMSNMDIYVSENLGTNALHYQEHIILTEMAKILGEPSGKFEEIAEGIKQGMNAHLWIDEKGYYAQYLYGKHHLIKSPRFEALGEALSVIFGIADAARAKTIVSQSPLTDFGATCIYPQIPGIPPYHNDAIWPFVQSYWNLAAAKTGNEKVLNHGLASIYRAAGLFLSNYENMDTETGDFKATEINSHQMLWSIAGNLAMVHRVFFGMEFHPDRLTFQPVIPEVYGGTMRLTNFTYRNATLDITVMGFGNAISGIEIDGEEVYRAEIPFDLQGSHTIVIQLDNKSFDNQEINLVKNHYTLANPIVKLQGDSLAWNLVKNASAYLVYRNGRSLKFTDTTFFTPDPTDLPAEYAVSAIDSAGYESFISDPISIGAKPKIVEIEGYTNKSSEKYLNFSGPGFVEVSTETHREIIIPLKLEPGEYMVDLRYSNGSGHWNTDNKCAIRSLFLNADYIGPVVMPQRGLDEWSDWGYSNAHSITIGEGENTLKISFEDWNINMNTEVNKAMIDHIRFTRIE
jgi:hypothetical protein